MDDTNAGREETKVLDRVNIDIVRIQAGWKENAVRERNGRISILRNIWKATHE